MDEILKQTKVDWEVCDPTTNDIKQYQLSWYMELSPFMLEEEEEEEEEGEEEDEEQDKSWEEMNKFNQVPPDSRTKTKKVICPMGRRRQTFQILCVVGVFWLF